MTKSRFVAEENDFTITSPKRVCPTCKHKHDGKSTCKVFPKRIPKDILRGGECPEHKEK